LVCYGVRPNKAWEEIMDLRDFLLLVALATAAATPAFGQAVPPAEPSAGSTQGAAIPDFSGVWSHPSFPGFEPPASGPGPVVNKSRRPQVNFDGRVLPPSSGILVSNPAQLVGDYSNPILKPHAAEVVKQHGEMELSGAGSPTPTIQCWPEPVPYIFNGVAMEMLQQPDKIVFLYPNDHQVRYVRMNRSHPAPLTPSWYGDSVGRYEGDTPVIDTVGVKIGPFAMVDFYGTPYTAALHVVERYRLLDYEAAKEGLGTRGRTCARHGAPMRARRPTTATGASTCNSASRSKTTVSSPCPGRRRSPIGVDKKIGGKSCAPRTSRNWQLRDGAPRCRP
jgi:hypothetical protein